MENLGNFESCRISHNFQKKNFEVKVCLKNRPPGKIIFTWDLSLKFPTLDGAHTKPMNHTKMTVGKIQIPINFIDPNRQFLIENP
jgi:hypothetical protein